MFEGVIDYAWKKKRSRVIEELKAIISDLSSKCDDIRLLDVGCGSGSETLRYFQLLEPKFRKVEVVGLDIESKFLKCNYIHFVKGDARKLPFKDETFDIVTSTEVIEHFREGEAFISECHRVLKKQGYLLLTTPNRLRITAWPRNAVYWLKRKKIVPGPNPEHLREYTPNELCKLCEMHGFKVIELDFIAFNPYLPIPPKIYRRLDSLTDKLLKSHNKMGFYSGS